jgi:hypothetical protein
VSDRCSACGAPIRWTVSKSGKRFPMDVAPNRTHGLFQIVEREGRPDEAVFAGPLFQSHFVSCPRAAEFRKK